MRRIVGNGFGLLFFNARKAAPAALRSVKPKIVRKNGVKNVKTTMECHVLKNMRASRNRAPRAGLIAPPIVLFCVLLYGAHHLVPPADSVPTSSLSRDPSLLRGSVAPGESIHKGAINSRGVYELATINRNGNPVLPEETYHCEPPCRRLRNGVEIPYLLYGTAWKEERSEKLVQVAIRQGFRGFDTAAQRRHYNEQGSGAAISGAMKSGSVTRSELFLQSKYSFPRGHLPGQEPFDPKATTKDQVLQSFEHSLRNFGTDYLDSYILHGPWKHGRDLAPQDLEVWAALEDLYRAGRVRAIGVSNFGAEQLQALINDLSTSVVPMVAQIRTFANRGWDDRVGGVRGICESEGILFQAFSLLTANRMVLKDAGLQRMAIAREETVEQLLFRFAFHEGMVVLTGTTNEAHMDQDLTTSLSSMSDRGKQLSDDEARKIRGVSIFKKKHRPEHLRPSIRR